jgi:hypothetical protein
VAPLVAILTTSGQGLDLPTDIISLEKFKTIVY